MGCVVVFFVVTVAPLASPARAHRRADLLVFVVGVLAFIVIIVSESGDVMSDIIVVVVLLTRVGGGGAAQESAESLVCLQPRPKHKFPKRTQFTIKWRF